MNTVDTLFLNSIHIIILSFSFRILSSSTFGILFAKSNFHLFAQSLELQMKISMRLVTSLDGLSTWRYSNDCFNATSRRYVQLLKGRVSKSVSHDSGSL
jgi:hypothetical protein